MEITRLSRSQKKQAAEVSARAFFQYPMIRFYFPDEHLQARFLPRYMELMHNCGLRYGDIYAAVPPAQDAVAGTACFLPPGHTKIRLWEYLLNGLGIALSLWRAQDYSLATACERYVEEAHDRIMWGRPHYYLWWLTVDPGQQARGIGLALMQPGLEKACAQKVPVYLETHAEKNVRYYQKRGFDLVRAEKVPGYDLTFWCMIREP